jgi:hypothetical protein
MALRRPASYLYEARKHVDSLDLPCAKTELSQEAFVQTCRDDDKKDYGKRLKLEACPIETQSRTTILRDHAILVDLTLLLWLPHCIKPSQARAECVRQSRGTWALALHVSSGPDATLLAAV